MSPTEATGRLRQAEAELRSNGQIKSNLEIPPADFQAPELPAGVPPELAEFARPEPTVTSNGQSSATSNGQNVAPANAQPVQQEPTSPDLQKEIEETKAKIAELEAKTNDAKTPEQSSGTASSPSPETPIQPTAGPVEITADTVVRLSDGSVLTGKELDGQRIQQSRLSREKRQLHEERQSLEQEKAKIEKVKASPIGRTLLEGLASGLPDEKIIEAGAALVGKTISTVSTEPEIPQPDDPKYEEKLFARSKWEQERQMAPLMNKLASLESQLEGLRNPQPQPQSTAQANQKVFEKVIGSRLPELTPEQQQRLREHLVATGDREDVNVPVDDFSWGHKAYTEDQMRMLFLAAFPNGQLPGSVVGQSLPQPTPQALPKEAALLELQRTRETLAKLERELGLRPPPQPKQPVPEAGPQPPVGGDNVALFTAPPIGNADAMSRVRSLTQELRSGK